MNKIIKFGAITVGFLVVILVIVNLTSSSMNLRSSKKVAYLGAGMNNTLPQSASLSSSLPADSVMSEKMSYPVAAPSYDTQTSGDLSGVDKKIIKNGDLNLKVDSADQAAEKISEIAKENSGEVLSSNFYQSSGNIKNGSLIVKVPLANFEKTFAEIKKVSSLVISESTSGQDVTEQYIDLKAQLLNRQAEEQSFLRILEQAQKIDDVLAVTRELARVRGDIEQLQGRIKYLESQTDMSTISVSLTEDANITVVDSWRPLQVLKEAFNSLIKGLQGMVDLTIRFVVTIVPLLLILGGIIWIVYRIGKKIYFKNKSEKQNN